MGFGLGLECLEDLTLFGRRRSLGSLGLSRRERSCLVKNAHMLMGSLEGLFAFLCLRCLSVEACVELLFLMLSLINNV